MGTLKGVEVINGKKLRPISSVHVDIASFLWETEAVLESGCAEQWLRDLRKCLARRDPTFSEYGAHLLNEVEEFREAERQRKSKNKDGGCANNGRPPHEPPHPEPTRHDPEEIHPVGEPETETDPVYEADSIPEKEAPLVETQNDLVVFQPKVSVGGIIEAKATEVQTTRKRGLKPLTEPNDAAFAEWWSAYPRKTGKLDAFTSWEKSWKIRPPVAEMIATLEWQKQSAAWTKDNGQFIPMPSTYLNQGRWTDEAPPAPKTYEQQMEDKMEAINKRYRDAGHKC